MPDNYPENDKATKLIQSLMKKLKLTEREVCKLIDISPPTAWRWRTKQRAVSEYSMLKLAVIAEKHGIRF